MFRAGAAGRGKRRGGGDGPRPGGTRATLRGLNFSPRVAGPYGRPVLWATWRTAVGSARPARTTRSGRRPAGRCEPLFSSPPPPVLGGTGTLPLGVRAAGRGQAPQAVRLLCRASRRCGSHGDRGLGSAEEDAVGASLRGTPGRWGAGAALPCKWGGGGFSTCGVCPSGSSVCGDRRS